MEDVGGLPGGGGNCSPFSLAKQITGLLMSKCLSEIRSHSQPQLASKWILAFFYRFAAQIRCIQGGQ